MLDAAGMGGELAPGREDRTAIAPADTPAPLTHGDEGPDQGPLEVGEDFGRRYRIIKMLGVGGMGAVYQAWDKELDIVVALKVVRPEVTANPEMAAEMDRRFKRELLLAREVTHRNVVRIHDLGEIDGVKYITMSFIDGEDLSSILKRENKLSARDALRIMRSVLSGLVAAHRAGVVHRDLKPANIMIDRAGEAYIMDFGIARSATGPEGQAMPVGIGQLDSQRTDLGHTAAGAMVGTMDYMSPEQFKGQVADQRSDLYTFGLIFYDLLLGPRPARRLKSAIAETTKRSQEAPPSPKSVDAEIPDAVDRIIARCLEPDPAKRFQSAAEVAAALDRLDEDGVSLPVLRRLTWRWAAAAGIAVLVLLAGTFWLARSGAPEEAPAPMSVLIADFENDAPEFDGAVEQALTIAMEGAGFINAYSRAKAQGLAEQLRPGSPLDETMARLVSRREGIDVIVVGAVEQQGRGYRVSAQALDPALESEASRPLATARASASSEGRVLQAVGEVAADLRRRLGDTTPESVRLAAAETFTAASLEAMRHYAEGQELTGKGNFAEAIGAYEAALQEDPEFGRAYAGLGFVYGNLRQQEKAEESFQKALQHLDRMSERERYRTLGGYYLLVSRNYEQAIENYSKLVELYPADGVGPSNLALAYLYVRDLQQAVVFGRRALELDPNNVLKRMNYAMYAMYAGDFATAIEESERILEENPDFGYARFTLARSALASGDIEAAQSALEELAGSAGPGSSLAGIGQADLDMVVGRYAEAVTLLEPTVEGDAVLSDGGRAPELLVLAEAYQALGKDDDARLAARRAIQLSRQESILYPAARVLIAVGDLDHAQGLAIELENMLQSQTAAYADLIRGEIYLVGNRLLPAIEAFRAAVERYDSWFGHYLLGRTYIEAEHYPEALGELQTCVDRTGEVVDLFVVDSATLRYLPPVHYWLARSQEGIGDLEAARQSYERFLELRRTVGSTDPLVADAVKRVASL